MRNGLSSCIQILAYLPALRLTPVLHQGSVAAPAKDDRHGKEPAIPRPMIAVTDRNFIAQDNVGGALLLLGNLMTPIRISRLRPRSTPVSRSNLGAHLQAHGHRPRRSSNTNAKSYLGSPACWLQPTPI